MARIRQKETSRIQSLRGDTISSGRCKQTNFNRSPRILMALIMLISFKRAWSESYCMLCKDGVPGLQRPYFKVDPYGKTCAAKMTDMAHDYISGSRQCKNQKIKFREMCCGDDEPEEIEQKPPPDYNGPMGPHPACKLCRDGTYPSNPSMVINMLYLGADSCARYHVHGERGLIPEHLCSTLQHFAYDPCGCGVITKAPNPSPTPAPAPSPGGNNGGGNGGGNGNGGSGGNGGGDGNDNDEDDDEASIFDGLKSFFCEIFPSLC